MNRFALLSTLLLTICTACGSSADSQQDVVDMAPAIDAARGEVTDLVAQEGTAFEVKLDSGTTDTADAGLQDLGFDDTGPQDTGFDLADLSTLDGTAEDLSPDLPPDMEEEIDLVPQDTGPPVCEAEPGQMCEGESDCPEGCQCREKPCPKCGAPPPWYCVKPPCADACWTDEDCEGDLYCASANIDSGLLGRCLWEVEPPECWNHGECPPFSKCHAAAYCPPCFACSVIEKPGTCEADLGTDTVLLWLPDTLYGPGEALSPVWWNFTNSDIYLPGCTTYWIEKQSPFTGSWSTAVPPPLCGWEGLAIKLWQGASHQAMTMTLPNDAQGQHRLHGQYWTGCTDIKPISEADCQGGPFDVYHEFFVGAAP